MFLSRKSPENIIVVFKPRPRPDPEKRPRNCHKRRNPPDKKIG